MFSIGDKVRVKGDHADSHWVVMMIYYDMHKIGVMHSTKHGTIQRVVDPLDLTLVDSKEDWKQAIREVLLSEEFLSAFAKAFVNASIPSTIQPAVAWHLPPKQSPQLPDGWRWLEVGEVVRDGDAYRHGGKWWDYDNSIGAKVLDTNWPSIRRNKFEVGEKVVECVNNRIGVVDDIEAIGRETYFLYHVEMQDTKGMIVFSPNQIAPYIEETT